MNTLVSLFEQARAEFSDRNAVIDPDGPILWGAFVDRIARAASALTDLGLNKGDRFAILAANSAQQAELIYGGYWSGCIPVPINFRLTAKEIALILADADCQILFLDAQFSDLLQADELAAFRSTCVYLGAPDYQALIKSSAPAMPQSADKDDLAILIYTGGTTGQSKGVRLSHGNILANGQQLITALNIEPDDIYLHVAPMFHSADFIGTGFTMEGAAHAYLAAPTPAAILQTLERTRATVVMLPPTLIIGMLHEPDLANYDLSDLRCIFYGSAPMAAEWIKKTMAAFPNTEIVQGYGLTETAPILTTLGGPEHRQTVASGDDTLLKSAGKPVTGIELKIVNDNGDEVPCGGSGEVIVKGANVTPGYHNLPDLNTQSFRDGWFHTGDIGCVDAQGYLFLQDRKKDMIITGGENVYSAEVEAALYQHPHVHETAVIGTPDDKYGEAVFAAIVAKPGTSLTADEIIAHCRGRIAGYKIPRQMAFVEALPKSAMGKILKTELRKQFAGG